MSTLLRTVGRRIAAVMAIICAILVVGIVPGRALDAPSGPVILTVDGRIADANAAGGRAEFDLTMLERLPIATVVTETPWTQGPVRFEGVLLADLLQLVGATGQTLRAFAINDYAVEIPVSDTMAYPVLVALRMDGAYMPVRKKGPMWVVFPWSDHPEIANEVYYARSIWQLKRIAVE